MRLSENGFYFYYHPVDVTASGVGAAPVVGTQAADCTDMVSKDSVLKTS